MESALSGKSIESWSDLGVLVTGMFHDSCKSCHSCLDPLVPTLYRGDSIMELRQCSRFIPQYEIMVALFSDEGCVLTGTLVDLSRSGLAFHYTPGSNCKIPRDALCGVMVQIGRAPSSNPILCQIVYETPTTTRTRMTASAKRCGVRFNKMLTVSAVEALLSV